MSLGIALGTALFLVIHFGAISIINIPSNLNKQTTHRYGPNSFKLHRLPHPPRRASIGIGGSKRDRKINSTENSWRQTTFFNRWYLYDMDLIYLREWKKKRIGKVPLLVHPGVQGCGDKVSI